MVENDVLPILPADAMPSPPSECGDFPGGYAGSSMAPRETPRGDRNRFRRLASWNPPHEDDFGLGRRKPHKSHWHGKCNSYKSVRCYLGFTMFLECSTMHDIDRTQLQSGMRLGEQEVGYQEFESELFESELLESEGEGEAESEMFYEGEDEAYEGEGEAYKGEGEAYEGEGEADEGEGEEDEGEGEADEGEGEAYEGEAGEGEVEADEGEGEAYEGEGEAYEGEGEAYEGEAYEGEGEVYETEAEQFYANEAWEAEMAAELLAVRDEAELEQFLGSFVSSAAKGLSSLAKKAAPVLLPALKSVAKQALPFVGGALGGLAGGPIGAPIGSQLASTAGDMFGLELEGLSFEDQEFEVAKQFVRFANDAVNNLGETAHHHSDPKRAAHAAVSASAHKNAPGLHSSSPSHQGGRAPHPGGAPASHRNGAGASHHAGSRPPHQGAPRPPQHAGPRPSHQGAPRPQQHAGPRPPQHAGPRPQQHAGPRPPQHAGPRPPQHAGPRPPQYAGPRPSHLTGAPATGAAPRPGSSRRPPHSWPSPGMPMAGRGPIRSPGGPAPVAPSAAGPSTYIPGAPGRDWYRPGRLTVDGIFGYEPSSDPGFSDRVRYVDGIDQGAPAVVQGGGRGGTGRWYRRGNRIVLIGV